MEDLREKYEVVIGLEVHAQLKTKSKILRRTQLNLVMSKIRKSALLHWVCPGFCLY